MKLPTDQFDIIHIHKQLKTLTPKEQLVISLRFGFIRNYTFSLNECAIILKLTPERIRQIEAKALRKLGTPTRELNPNTLRINKFFVNQNGSDSNDGSYDYPLKSIQKALTKLHKTKAHV